MIEIERRYLIDPLKIPVQRLRMPETIRQGYLSYHPVVRIRRGNRCTLTIKGDGLLTRPELNFSVTKAEADALFDMVQGDVITKVRYQVICDDIVWEIDEFKGPLEGLWVGEVEMQSEDQTFELQPWVLEEVTEDPRYTNVALVQHGIPPRIPGLT